MVNSGLLHFFTITVWFTVYQISNVSKVVAAMYEHVLKLGLTFMSQSVKVPGSAEEKTHIWFMCSEMSTAEQSLKNRLCFVNPLVGLEARVVAWSGNSSQITSDRTRSLASDQDYVARGRQEVWIRLRGLVDISGGRGDFFTGLIQARGSPTTVLSDPLQLLRSKMQKSMIDPISWRTLLLIRKYTQGCCWLWAHWVGPSWQAHLLDPSK